MHKSGTTLVLKAGDYRAEIVTVGAGLASLRHRGRHVVIPHAPEELPLAHLGKVLIPWPNRITGGCYQFEGQTLTPAINDRASSTAIHGLLAWQNWQIAEQTPSNVTLTAFLPPTYGYPFMLAAEVTYQLDESEGLSTRILSKNIGDRTAPYGAGVHPYLTCNQQHINRCELQLPACQIFDVPSSTFCVVNTLDFEAARQIGSTYIDHTFHPLDTGSRWEVRLTDPQSAMAVWLRSSQPWIQIYSGEKLERKGLAVEPMSCPPDAFNSGIDLIRLRPGDTHQMGFEIGCE
ncbi:aldose-1-epimerase [Erwinia sp.]|uniref:aldose-1-epimerase n=1 Tax=Erwinia citreus TaxID=558 RepID=UPI003C71B5D2